MSITDRIFKLKSFIAGRDSDSYFEDPFSWDDYIKPPIHKGIESNEKPKEEAPKVTSVDGCPACVAHNLTLSRLSHLSGAHSGSSEAVRGHIDAARTLLNNAHDMHVDDAHGGDNSRRASVEFKSTASSRIASLRSQLNR
jgi:hypothetical protein